MYEISFTYYDEKCFLDVMPGCILDENVLSPEDADKLFEDLFRLDYVVKENKFCVTVNPNPYFTEVKLSNFLFYDESKDDYLPYDWGDGVVTSSLMNPVCDTPIDEQTMLAMLQKRYAGRADYVYVRFESLSYGIHSL